MEKSFQTGKGIANKLDLDLVFNNNNFASQSKLLDKDKKQYFSLVAERFARCGEALVTDLLAEKKRTSRLLSNLHGGSTNSRATSWYHSIW